MKKQYLSALQIMQILGISRSAAYKLLDGTQFPVAHVGRNLRVEAEVFNNWLARITF